MSARIADVDLSGYLSKIDVDKFHALVGDYAPVVVIMGILFLIIIDARNDEGEPIPDCPHCGSNNDHELVSTDGRYSNYRCYSCGRHFRFAP